MDWGKVHQRTSTLKVLVLGCRQISLPVYNIPEVSCLFFIPLCPLIMASKIFRLELRNLFNSWGHLKCVQLVMAGSASINDKRLLSAANKNRCCDYFEAEAFGHLTLNTIRLCCWRTIKNLTWLNKSIFKHLKTMKLLQKMSDLNFHWMRSDEVTQW